jgi:hypothetical protein
MTILNSAIGEALAAKPAFNTNCRENFPEILHVHIAAKEH